MADRLVAIAQYHHPNPTQSRAFDTTVRRSDPYSRAVDISVASSPIVPAPSTPCVCVFLRRCAALHMLARRLASCRPTVRAGRGAVSCYPTVAVSRRRRACRRRRSGLVGKTSSGARNNTRVDQEKGALGRRGGRQPVEMDSGSAVHSMTESAATRGVNRSCTPSSGPNPPARSEWPGISCKSSLDTRQRNQYRRMSFQPQRNNRNRNMFRPTWK